MFNFLKRKKEEKPPELLDLAGNVLNEGDLVMCHRYELGKSVVELEGKQFFYKSEATGKRVSYVRMIDAITGNQKVEKTD